MTSSTLKRCIAIPAVKKNAVIPDQLVKKLAGVTLIQRAINTATRLVPAQDVWVITDSDEIRLVCERNGVRCVHDAALRIASLDIISALREKLETFASQYDNIIIYRASSPLITPEDMEDAYARFMESQSDCLVTLKSVKHRLWRAEGNDINALLFNDDEQSAYLETKALFMLRSEVLFRHSSNAVPLKTVPYFLNDRSIEINSYQDWWICEKLLQRKHIIFVVAGYAAIGMGHIYRALMLAHEIADHKITFLCTRESELAASNIAAKDYRTRLQEHAALADDVLALRPDLVVNDILNTDEKYMRRLKTAGIPVVNFEDEGSGAALADLVVNSIYETTEQTAPRFLYGSRYFCLRDEFLQAQQNSFSPTAKRVLVTFGGTDPADFTRQTLETIAPLCRSHNIEIVIVAGPGYAHTAALEQRIAELREQQQGPEIVFTNTTNVMSRMMEHVDFAICSAGRTVYELAHMRIPALVLSQHEREDQHTFARPGNGFLYIPAKGHFQPDAVFASVSTLCDANARKTCYDILSRFDFTRNKSRVVGAITALLPEQDS